MRAFFHHVGQRGAAEDFPKTVFSDVSIQVIERVLPDNHELKESVLSTLYNQFPTGLFNCWGVPSGAQSVIRSLSVGDAVLLVESTAGLGNIPVLGQVKAYWNIELHELSQTLWGNRKFPFVFYFQTEKINLTWQELIQYIGYSEKFRPSGNFYSIRDDRLDKFSGPSGFISYLRQNHLKQSGEKVLKASKSEFGELNKNNGPSDILAELETSKKGYRDLPNTEREAVEKSRVGQGLFRQKLIDFWNVCAVTSCNELMILRASHIKPWRNCDNAERLDVYNGLLLLPNLDTLFDLGLISFTDDGGILISMRLDTETIEITGLDTAMCLKRIEEPHLKYLRFHRNHVFLS